MEFFRASGILGVQVRPIRSGERGAAIPVKVKRLPTWEQIKTLSTFFICLFKARSREPRPSEEASDGEDDAPEGAAAEGGQGTALLHAAGRLHPRRLRARHAGQMTEGQGRKTRTT